MAFFPPLFIIDHSELKLKFSQKSNFWIIPSKKKKNYQITDVTGRKEVTIWWLYLEVQALEF